MNESIIHPPRNTPLKFASFGSLPESYGEGMAFIVKVERDKTHVEEARFEI